MNRQEAEDSLRRLPSKESMLAKIGATGRDEENEYGKGAKNMWHQIRHDLMMTTMRPRRWEYLSYEESFTTDEMGTGAVTDWLDKLGENGWEVVHMASATSTDYTTIDISVLVKQEKR